MKHLRIYIGVTMLYGFMGTIFALWFFSQLQYETWTQYFLCMTIFNFFWLPHLILIMITYLLLTKVYPYEKENKVAKQKEGETTTGNERV